MRFFIFLVFISNLFSQVDYNNDIQPIFQSRCVSCHGYSGGLNLTSYSNLMNGGNSGPSIVAENHSSSLLYIRVENGTMPPSGTLTTDQINLIAQWIDEGALETPATNYTGPVWHIATTGSDENGDGSDSSPFVSIQKGIDSAVDGDTVLVASGTYVENIDYSSKQLVVASHFLGSDGDDDFISNTIIDGDSTASCVTMNGSGSELIGFTLTNGYSNDEMKGSAVTMQEDAISYCLLTNNYSYGSAPIIIPGSTNSSFDHLTIYDNYGYGNGGMILNGGQWPNDIIANACCNNTDEFNIANSIFGGFEYYGGYGPVENYSNNYSLMEVSSSSFFPSFCDPENGDYSLAANSPCVSTVLNGVNIGAFGVGCDALVSPCALGTVYVSEGHNQGDPEDYIEIYNSGTDSCSLAGFKLDDNDDFEDLTFSDVVLTAGGYWLGYRNAEGSFGSGLGGNGDEIWLSDPSGTTRMVALLASMQAEDGTELSQSFNSDGTGCYTMPTPGEVNTECITFTVTPCEIGVVYVSEGHPSGDPEDYIEIYNSGSDSCSLAGFKLDDSNEFDDLTFSEVVVQAGGYWIGYKDEDGSFESGLSANGDEIWLSDPDGTTLMVTLLQTEELEDGTELSQSFDADGTGCYTLPTPSAVNSDCIYLSSDAEINIPEQYSLLQNYPNPFNPITSISYQLPKDEFVTLMVYDMRGRMIKTLISSNQTAGNKVVQWDATNNKNEIVSAGLYLYIIQAGEFRHTRKMVLIK